jgi:hypothetical protein
VRPLHDSVALLRAVAGMYRPDNGDKQIDRAVNAVQSLVVAQSGGRWLAVLFQNTPAAFHGRPELGEALTKELQSALDSGQAQWNGTPG